VLADGDFTITIPAGTILSSGAFYVIGSNNSPVSADLNIASCNCTSGAPNVIGTLTNGNEQLILLDDAGGIVDAIQWGIGQFPVNISAPGTGSCIPRNINFSNTSSVFETLPQGGGNGCTMARRCDGSAVWEERCNAGISGGASNGQPPVPAFSASSQLICPSECLSFFDQSSGTAINAWNWLFPGSLSGGSVLPNPAGVCYAQPGAYDVTLTISGLCGNFSLTLDSFVVVDAPDSAFILPSSLPSLCIGDTALLHAGGAGPFQWLRDGILLTGISADTLSAVLPGSYALVSGSGACADTSDFLTLGSFMAPILSVSTVGVPVLCQGDSLLLQVNAGASIYSFILNNNIISTQTDTFLYVHQPGVYFVVASNTNCTDTSNQVVINPVGVNSAVISVVGNNPLCEGSTLQLMPSNTTGAFQWLMNGVPILGATDSLLMVQQAGNYALISNPAASCADTSAVLIVQVLPATEPVIQASSYPSVCPGDSLLLFPSVNADSLVWFFDGTALPGQRDSIYVNSAGIYQLVVQYANGCTRSSPPYAVSVYEVVPPSILASPPRACEGDEVFLTVSGIDAASIEWSDGSSGALLLIHQSGNYSISATNAEGCRTTAAIDFYFAPLPAVDAGTDQVNVCGEGIVLTGNTQAASFEWVSPEKPDNPYTLNLNVNPIGDTFFVLIARDSLCTNADTVHVYASECELYVPDAFSPNSDGHNDFFRARGPALSSLSIGVFDRWGIRVAELHSFEEAWNGEIDGKPAASGVYQWVIFQARDLRGNELKARGRSRGNVTLFR
jgi:gliding motility-associated-like protein